MAHKKVKGVVGGFYNSRNVEHIASFFVWVGGKLNTNGALRKGSESLGVVKYGNVNSSCIFRVKVDGVVMKSIQFGFV